MMNMDQLMKGEVRRVHVLYFLSRNGAVEQPHLIRIHHLHRSGVYLRDVKRWLADLRGKEMPDCFSWSYKRRYKSDFVWQDLTDDELITPFSDNEYVLKGSEISSSYQTSSRDTNASDEDEKETPPPPPHSGSDISNESAKHATSIINIDFWQQELEEKKNELKSECTSSDRISPKEQISSNNSKIRSSGKSSKLLRSLFHCGGVDTDGSGMRIIQRNKKYHAVNGSSYKSMDEYLKNEKPRTRRSNTM